MTSKWKKCWKCLKRIVQADMREGQPMGKCVYCGKKISSEPHKAKAHTRYFDVCGDVCKEKVVDYVKKDKKFKLPMFLAIFIGGIGFFISAMLGSGDRMMLGAYIGQVLAGIVFLIFPYPIVSFETFETVAIKKVNLICRCIGIFFLVFGIILLHSVLK
jgi:Archaeal TRASH domain.